MCMDICMYMFVINNLLAYEKDVDNETRPHKENKCKLVS